MKPNKRETNLKIYFYILVRSRKEKKKKNKNCIFVSFSSHKIDRALGVVVLRRLMLSFYL